MQFQYFRLLLLDNKEPSLYGEKYKSRRELLNDVFAKGKQISLEIKDDEYLFYVKEKFGDIASAIFAKKDKTKIFDRPDKEVKPHEQETWPRSNVLVNLSDEKETGMAIERGQVIAFEINNVAPAKYALNQIARKVNETILDSGYKMVISPMQDKGQGFWNIVEENKDKIRTVKFTYYTPNVLGLKNSLQKDIEEDSKKYNVNTISVSIHNPDKPLTLSEDDGFLSQSAEYTELGQGEFEIGVVSEGKRGRGKRKILTKKSKDKPKSRAFDIEDSDDIVAKKAIEILSENND